MIRRTHSRVTLAALFVLALVIPAATLGASIPDPFEINASFPLHFVLAYTWDGSSTGYSDWYLNRDHTFTDASSGTGTWTKATGVIHLLYSTGCAPDYAGRLSPGTVHLDGQMNCTTRSMHGTWYADLVPGTTPVHGGQTNGAPPASGMR